MQVLRGILSGYAHQLGVHLRGAFSVVDPRRGLSPGYADQPGGSYPGDYSLGVFLWGVISRGLSPAFCSMCVPQPYDVNYVKLVPDRPNSRPRSAVYLLRYRLAGLKSACKLEMNLSLRETYLISSVCCNRRYAGYFSKIMHDEKSRAIRRFCSCLNGSYGGEISF